MGMHKYGSICQPLVRHRSQQRNLTLPARYYKIRQSRWVCISMAASANRLSGTGHNKGTSPCLPDIIKFDSLDGYAQVHQHLPTACQAPVTTKEPHLPSLIL